MKKLKIFPCFFRAINFLKNQLTTSRVIVHINFKPLIFRAPVERCFELFQFRLVTEKFRRQTLRLAKGARFNQGI